MDLEHGVDRIDNWIEDNKETMEISIADSWQAVRDCPLDILQGDDHIRRAPPRRRRRKSINAPQNCVTNIITQYTHPEHSGGRSGNIWHALFINTPTVILHSNSRRKNYAPGWIYAAIEDFSWNIAIRTDSARITNAEKDCAWLIAKKTHFFRIMVQHSIIN